jgi:hypothetical protein
LQIRQIAAAVAFAITIDAFATGNGSGLAVPQPSRFTQNYVAGIEAPQTWVVQNCSDDAPGSLRDIIEDPMKAKSGDTIDLSQLPASCGANSTITLTTGQIEVLQDDLKLQGPVDGLSTVTLTAAHASRVLNHGGYGVLAIYGLNITAGYYDSPAEAYGGCINGGVGGSTIVLDHSTVRDCKAHTLDGHAFGGGIRSHNVVLRSSSVSGNESISENARSYGGGIYAETLLTVYSNISSNSAWKGGGAYVANNILIERSTIDGNSASYGGGLALNNPASATIAESTISGNEAQMLAAAAYFTSAVSALISNSTIAFNHSDTSLSQAGAVFFAGADVPSPLTLQSTIIANNMAAGNPADLYVSQGILTGSTNLVNASNTSPAGVITVTGDPQLGPLQWNGGHTRSHQLAVSSPAIGAGNDSALDETDQRGSGYARTTNLNGSISVDIGATQFDVIFTDAFEGS